MALRLALGWAAVLLAACTQEVPASSQFAKADAADASAGASDASGDASGDATSASDAPPGAIGDAGGPCLPADCDDGNPCTTDACLADQCSHGVQSNGVGCGAFKACWSGKCVADCGKGFRTWSADAGDATVKFCAAEYPAWGIAPLSPTGFSVSGDGIVSHALTGLQWQQASAPDKLSWDQAVSYCDLKLVLGGHSDWRLPTRAELDSLIDFTLEKPAINPTVFPGTALDRYWSASPAYGTPAEAWGAEFAVGFVSTELMSNPRSVRCVRGQGEAPSFAQRFSVDAAQGTVYDHATQRTWQRAVDTSGGSDGAGGRTLMQALGYCDKLSLAGGGWRLPDVRELRALVDASVEQPAIDHAAFPSTPLQGFWSHTAHAKVATDYWYVHFLDGFSDVEDVAALKLVRCVR